MADLTGLTDVTTKCRQADQALAGQPTWDRATGGADQKATLTFPPTCRTAGSLAPRSTPREWNYSRAATRKTLPLPLLCLPPALPTASVRFALAAEASAEKSVSTFLANPVSAARSAQAEGKGRALCTGGSAQAPCGAVTASDRCGKLTTKRPDGEFMQKRGCDKLNILFLCSVPSSATQGRGMQGT